MENIKKLMWQGGKTAVLIAGILYIVKAVANLLETFWADWLLHRFTIFTAGSFSGIILFLASILLTALSFLFIGYLLSLTRVKRTLNFLSKHVPLLRYIWSDEDGLQKFTPVIFQNPVPGEYKIGFITGEQELDRNGERKKLWRVFYITGIGDHVLVDKDRPDLLVPLSNPALEVAQLIGSFMTSGPRTLREKKNGSLLPEKEK